MSVADEGFSTEEVTLGKQGFYKQSLTGTAVSKHFAGIILLL